MAPQLTDGEAGFVCGFRYAKPDATLREAPRRRGPPSQLDGAVRGRGGDLQLAQGEAPLAHRPRGRRCGAVPRGTRGYPRGADAARVQAVRGKR